MMYMLLTSVQEVVKAGMTTYRNPRLMTCHGLRNMNLKLT